MSSRARTVVLAILVPVTALATCVAFSLTTGGCDAKSWEVNSVVLKACYEACQPSGMASYTRERCQCVAGLPAPTPTKSN